MTATNTNATNTTTTTTTNNDEVVVEEEKVADEDDDADNTVDGSKDENPQKIQEEEEMKRIPSIGNAFLIYAVLPLFLFMLPTIIMQLITMDYSSSISESLAFFGLLTRNDTMSTAATTSTSPPFNIDREIKYLQNIEENSRQREITNEIQQQQKQQQQQQQHSSAQSTNSIRSSGGRDNSPKSKMDEAIAVARHSFESDPTDPLKALQLADLLRNRDITFFDGGSVRAEAIKTYQHAIQTLLLHRKNLLDQGQSTNEITDMEALQFMQNNPELGNDELYIFDYKRKSVDGLLCAALTSLSKVFYMANMFEDSVDTTNLALQFKPYDLDAINQRANTYIILGKYKEAADDYVYMLEADRNRLFVDAFTGLAKVLTVKEGVVPGGWTALITVVNGHLALLEEKRQKNTSPEALSQYADKLHRMHMVLFQYYDTKVNDTDLAWTHLQKGKHYKMVTVQPFHFQADNQRIQSVIDVFQPGIWTPGTGSDSVTPIFIVGFVRSGSTLLERILDSHHLIVGTGEDSIFNGQLAQIRNAIVAASTEGPEELQRATLAQADFILNAMRERWASSSGSSKNEEANEEISPQRFVDKMLTNYLNVGFIHMVFPKALILHVARNPMDTIFSSYKHDFAPGHLDYLSEFESLAQTYVNYRKVMNHWDKVLPGRVTHVRYEDIVNDLPGMAKAIIAATGLPWDPEVLKFHEKKHAVNTLSTTQVRKAIYKDAMNSWLRYEKQLAPLVDLIGENAEYPLKTSLLGYDPPLNDGGF